MNYLKFTTLAFLLLAIAPLSSSAQDATPKDVSVIRAKLMLRNGSTMIDVREKEEVAEVAYDVENVINIPLSQLQARMSEVPKDKPLVIACQSGSRSEQASMILLENGYTDLVNMEGGMNASHERPRMGNQARLSRGITTPGAPLLQYFAFVAVPHPWVRKEIVRPGRMVCAGLEALPSATRAGHRKDDR